MKEDKQLKLLTQGNDMALSKFKKTVRIKKAGSPSQSKKLDLFFDNLITVEELATIFRVNPQTIRNWVARGKIPHVQIGRRNLFQMGSIQKWLNQKEEPLWE